MERVLVILWKSHQQRAKSKSLIIAPLETGTLPHALLGESDGWLRLLGAAAIAAGVVALAVGRKR